jgi:hypothetical protein
LLSQLLSPSLLAYALPLLLPSLLAYALPWLSPSE